MARLRKLDRQTLKSFYVEGRSLKEMCDEFKAPVGTIKRRLHVARQRLAKVGGTFGVAAWLRTRKKSRRPAGQVGGRVSR